MDPGKYINYAELLTKLTGRERGEHLQPISPRSMYDGSLKPRFRRFPVIASESNFILEYRVRAKFDVVPNVT